MKKVKNLKALTDSDLQNLKGGTSFGLLGAEPQGGSNDGSDD